MNKNFYIGHILDILVYGMLLIFLTVLQTSFIPRFPIYKGLPDIMIGAVCFMGIYRGETYSAIFGLIAGLCCDALGSTGVSLLPLFYTIAGYVCGRIGFGAKENKRFAAYLITLPLLCLSRTALSFINHLIVYWNSIDLIQLFLFTLLPEFIYTLVMCLPIYLIVKIFDIPLNLARKGGILY